MHIYMKVTKTPNNIPILSKFFGVFFLLTGIFSFVSSLFAWGQGWLFSIKNINLFLVPMADLLTTFPLSIITAYGILKNKSWGILFGIFTSGIYFFGSIIVFIIIFYNTNPFQFQLFIPSIIGFLFSITFFIYTVINKVKQA